ncbi:MAG TPA: AraC family transcriptional regulator [Candidatus Acidoferrum sp.]|nr:AraC family transcriptional regulator [Candidatus Acidoferrum sp.]
MRSDPQPVTHRRNEALRYWRHHDLGEATLVAARYGPFTWEKHVHDEQVVVLSERGAGEVRTRRGVEIGGAGTIWVFAPGEYHYGRVEDGRTWHYRALYLERNALEAIATQLGTSSSDRLLKPGLHHDPWLARMLLRAHASDGVDAATEQVAWNDALSALFARYGDPRRVPAPAGADRPAVQRARDYIAEHFRDTISVEDLARLVNVSRYHFIRAFRLEYGMPPHAYLNQVRVQHARRLLLTGRTAAEAAAASGLYDQSRLNHLFKRVYGVTPAQYAHPINV